MDKMFSKKYLLVAPFFLLIFTFFFIPLTSLIALSFKTPSGFSFQNYIDILSDAFYYSSFLLSLKIAMITAPIALIIGIAVSRYTHESSHKKQILNICTLLKNFAGIPLVLGFTIAFGFNGALSTPIRSLFGIENYNIYSPTGYVIASLAFMIPNAIIFCTPIWETIDPNWERAAKILGARHGEYIRRVLAPLLMVRFFSVWVILLADSITTYATAYALSSGGLNVVTLKIAAMAAGDIFVEIEKASAMSVVMCAFLLLLIVVRTLITRMMNLGQDHEI